MPSPEVVRENLAVAIKRICEVLARYAPHEKIGRCICCISKKDKQCVRSNPLRLNFSPKYSTPAVTAVIRVANSGMRGASNSSR